MRDPKVTIFMAVYNGEKYIRQAIDSALMQTFRDFELLVIDDGSTDNSIAIVNEYSDNRIRLLQNKTNLGLFLTRNRGMQEARGQYFATLDCDDIAPAERLEIQLAYFQANPGCGMCGGRIKYIDQHSAVTGRFSALRGDEDYLRSLLLFTNIFSNSATMIVTDILRELQYRQGFEPAEDFDLFERVAASHKIGFINEFLSYYRVHDNNISTIKSQHRKKAEREIIGRQLDRYGFEYNSNDLDIHLAFTTAEFDFVKYDVKTYAGWLNNLRDQNRSGKVFNARSFELALSKQWLRLCMNKFKTSRDIRPFWEKGMVSCRNIHKLI